VFIAAMSIERIEGISVECPICAGRGTTRGKAFSRLHPTSHVCGLCGGAGSIARGQVRDLMRIRNQMQRVADLMQAGDADAAARASRAAFRIARSMLEREGY
jgi:hypothetical protein